MATLIISILLSLNIITTSAEYEQMAPEEKAHLHVIIEDLHM